MTMAKKVRGHGPEFEGKLIRWQRRFMSQAPGARLKCGWLRGGDYPLSLVFQDAIREGDGPKAARYILERRQQRIRTHLAELSLSPMFQPRGTDHNKLVSERDKLLKEDANLKKILEIMSKVKRW